MYGSDLLLSESFSPMTTTIWGFSDVPDCGLTVTERFSVSPVIIINDSSLFEIFSVVIIIGSKTESSVMVVFSVTVSFVVVVVVGVVGRSVCTFGLSVGISFFAGFESIIFSCFGSGFTVTFKISTSVTLATVDKMSVVSSVGKSEDGPG